MPHIQIVLARTNNPECKTLKGFFTKQEHTDIKTKCATTGLPFTELVLYLLKNQKPAKKGKK